MLKAKLIEEEPLKINLNVNYTTTKAEPAEGVLCLKGTVGTFESLPTENKAGDVYLVGTESPYNEYLWTGEAWEALSPKPEPMPDFVERSELAHATESLKQEMAGELSKVSELAPKSELETLKSDFETKLEDMKGAINGLQGGNPSGNTAEDFKKLSDTVNYLNRMARDAAHKGSTIYRLYDTEEQLVLNGMAKALADMGVRNVPILASWAGTSTNSNSTGPWYVTKTEKGYRLEGSLKLDSVSIIGNLETYGDADQPLKYKNYIDVPTNIKRFALYAGAPRRLRLKSVDHQPEIIIYEFAYIALAEKGMVKPGKWKFYTEWEVDNA